MKRILYILSIVSTLTLSSCNKDFLVENPVNDIYAENLLVNLDGFESMNYALLSFVRDEYGRLDISYGSTSFSSLPFAKSVMWSCGIDNTWGNNRHNQTRFFSYPKNIVAMTDGEVFLSLFEWLYKVVNTANMVINRAENPDVDWQGGSPAADLANKERIIAEARLYRAWAYRHLTYSFGDVPLSTEEITGENYRVDWERNSVADIRKVMEEDFQYAIDKLPMRSNGNNTKPNQAVARHYLGELYLAEGNPSSAKSVLQPLVEGGDYSLMTSRFGKDASSSGNPFMDVFRSPLYTEGNNEVLWAFLNTEDENVAYGNAPSIFMKNMWQNYYSNLSQVKNLKHSQYEGTTIKLFWSLNGGKGAGRCAISLGAFALYKYDNQQNNDYRYGDDAFVWHLYFLDENNTRYEVLNSKSSLINLKANSAMSNDNDPTIKQYNLPSTRKWSYVYPIFDRSDDDQQYNDMVYLRLAETYLLYAEALYKLGDATGAAQWINKIRSRANVSSIPASAVSIDFILDERSRELITEEQRRHTLIRLSQENGGNERLSSSIFKTRVRTYNEVSGREVRGMHDDDTPVLFPVPQKFIDSNTGRRIEQNPGY
ncbi:MAG: RagB/SusD family nutrient uptake outer membrane protein [Bacteroidales bacterium]|nr:RagB/SusD family nutrient uptake outer membrane protein [Bacteroidales bacterium]MDD4670450.1 RagB/SusD family nutrient uptake outer membrane protein [Bacteroidales bacterium]